ncbi:MAG: carboxypeptidase-like regulatory domain-containing protein [Dysgonamonadaceae bacterium]|jgi:outer membrane biosynthesis protein TonB|nr:carboxypeptidase-like regulatory domain-containing protein [Dysgonamonadaceae bacterium]
MKLLDYIKGYRKGKNAHRIERQAMEDPFLEEALDGFDSVEGNHAKQIEALQKRISKKLQPKTYHLRTWSIAAGILICISIGGYFLVQYFPKPDLHSVVAYKEEIKSDENTAIVLNESVEIEPYTLTEEKTIPLRPKEKDKLEDVKIKMEKMPVSVDALPVTSIQTKKPEAILKHPYAYQEITGEVAGILSKVHLIGGKVVDREGEPLAGVSITQKGTQLGAVTGIDGTFSLNTNNNNPLEARYLGFESKEFSIDTSKMMLITMAENRQMLDEVVVLGYGTQIKGITGSVDASRQKPSPLMGMKAYQKYIGNSMIRPTDSECAGKKGTVVLEFSVDAKGNPINIVVKKSICISLDMEALRLLQQGPKWTTGTGTVELKVKF